MNEKNKVEKGVLYLVATPIGNLDDITLRALKVLRECDFIAAEDTRVTAKLLSAYDISKPVVIYQKFNGADSGKRIVERLKNGESCALVTDAGTPGISDPGSLVTKYCIEENIKVSPIPGACACIAALVASGLDTDGFIFEGFIGAKTSEMTERLEKIAFNDKTTVLYEAPHRIMKTLEVMKKVLGGDRKIVLCRELTKLNEEYLRTDVDGAIEHFGSTEPRGEFVILISKSENESNFWKNMTVREHVDYYIALGNDKMTAVKAAAKDRKLPKNEIYKEMI